VVRGTWNGSQRRGGAPVVATVRAVPAVARMEPLGTPSVTSTETVTTFVYEGCERYITEVPCEQEEGSRRRGSSANAVDEPIERRDDTLLSSVCRVGVAGYRSPAEGKMPVLIAASSGYRYPLYQGQSWSGLYLRGFHASTHFTAARRLGRWPLPVRFLRLRGIE